MPKNNGVISEEYVTRRLNSKSMPFDITQQIIKNITDTLNREREDSESKFTLGSAYLTWLSRQDARSIAVRRLRSACGLFERKDRLQRPEKALHLSVIELSMDDMIKGWIHMRMQVPPNQNYWHAVYFLQSDSLDWHCDQVGLDADWAFSVIKDLWKELENGANIDINR